MTEIDTPDRFTATERREIRTLIRNRFKLLRTELDAQQATFQAEIAQQVAQRLEKRRNRADALIKEAKAINDEWEKQSKELKEKFDGRINKVKNKIEKAANENLIVGECNNRTYYSSNIVSYHIDPYNEAAFITAVDKTARKMIATEKLNLQRQESDLLEQIALDSLKSDEAKWLISQLPDSQTLLSKNAAAELVIGELGFSDE